MSSLYARGDSIIPLVAAADQTGKEGYLVEIASNTQASVCNAATDLPYGVILAGAAAGAKSSIGVLGGLPAPVPVKVGTAITNLNVLLMLKSDGSVAPDSGSGARTIVGRPCEVGAVDELIAAVLFNPVSIAS